MQTILFATLIQLMTRVECDLQQKIIFDDITLNRRSHFRIFSTSDTIKKGQRSAKYIEKPLVNEEMKGNAGFARFPPFGGFCEEALINGGVIFDRLELVVDFSGRQVYKSCFLHLSVIRFTQFRTKGWSKWNEKTADLWSGFSMREFFSLRNSVS